MESDDTAQARARAFAVRAHGAQLYGSRPYAWHLDMVAAILEPWGGEAQVVGWLHDVIEDTDVTREQVAAEFGPFVAECVALLTDEPGATRRDRKPATYRKLARVEGRAELALIVKAADRLANVRCCVADRAARLLRTYRDEHALFREAARRPGLCDPLWDELDALLAPPGGEGGASAGR